MHGRGYKGGQQQISLGLSGNTYAQGEVGAAPRRQGPRGSGLLVAGCHLPLWVQAV